ncbi:MAG TPA: chorismate pyruvate-lyase family protein [Acidimicrobiia bacterium]|nr:chorismate pyruvate-lyase family protein [Acidimicrobiia bacterium]
MTALASSGRESAADPYDPLGDLFVAQFARPSDLLPVNLRALTPFQRSLLVIDGTVTKFLEAFTLQPVDVDLISQETRVLTESHEWLEAETKTTVIAREVVLRGRYDRVLHAHAASLLVLERLPVPVQNGLNTNPGGLGRILLESKLETRREVLWYGRQRSNHPRAGELSGREFLTRTYRIISSGRPLMLINEQFPMPDDLLPSHE